MRYVPENKRTGARYPAISQEQAEQMKSSPLTRNKYNYIPTSGTATDQPAEKDPEYTGPDAVVKEPAESKKVKQAKTEAAPEE